MKNHLQKNKNKVKLLFSLILIISFHSNNAQTVIKMERVNGVYMIPCKINGLPLKFIFDTGASDVSISLTEALFMVKNGYLKESDFVGTEYYKIANGDIQEGTKLIIKEIEIGKLKLYNVKASVTHTLGAPLLLGQTALTKLGKIEIDNSTLTIKGGPSDYVDSNDNSGSYSTLASSYNGQYKFETTIDRIFPAPLRQEPNINSLEIYSCPLDTPVFVIEIVSEIYCKVYINGHTGYISKSFLKRRA